MLEAMKSCVCLIFQAAPRKTIQYAVCKAIAAILFPVNVILIEKCINSMERASYQEFWLMFLAFGISAFALVGTEHRGRVADMEFAQEFTDVYLPRVIDRLSSIRYGYFEDEKAADVLSRLSGDPASALTGLFRKLVDCIALLIRLYGAALIYFRLSECPCFYCWRSRSTSESFPREKWSDCSRQRPRRRGSWGIWAICCAGRTPSSI